MDAQSLVDLYGTNEIRASFVEFRNAFGEFFAKAYVVTEAEAWRQAHRPDDGEIARIELDARTSIEEKRSALADAVDQLASQMRSTAAK